MVDVVGTVFTMSLVAHVKGDGTVTNNNCVDLDFSKRHVLVGTVATRIVTKNLANSSWEYLSG